MTKLFIRALFVVLVVSLVAPVAALAADPSPTGQFVFPALQVWTIVAGSLVTVVTYVLNKYAPWTSQSVKALVLVVASAVAAGLTQAIDGGTVGFNDQTLQLVVTAVIAAFGSHLLLWKPSGIQAKLTEPESTPTYSNGGPVVGDPTVPPGIR